MSSCSGSDQDLGFGVLGFGVRVYGRGLGFRVEACVTRVPFKRGGYF